MSVVSSESKSSLEVSGVEYDYNSEFRFGRVELLGKPIEKPIGIETGELVVFQDPKTCAAAYTYNVDGVEKLFLPQGDLLAKSSAIDFDTASLSALGDWVFCYKVVDNVTQGGIYVPRGRTRYVVWSAGPNSPDVVKPGVELIVNTAYATSFVVKHEGKLVQSVFLPPRHIAAVVN